jgi:FixJ family two-component response regulator
MLHTVYLVDDDPEFLSSFGELLTGEGFRVLLFQSGDQLMRHQPVDRPSLIVSDYSLSGMPGDELLRRLGRDVRWRGIPTVVVTGSSDSSLPVRINAPVVYKPNVTAMLGAIRSVLASTRKDSTPED